MPLYSSKNSIKNTKKQNLKTKIGIALIVISSIFLINLVFDLLAFVNSFFLGTFGLFSYAIFISLIIVGIMLIRNKIISLEPLDIILSVLWLVVLIIIIHLATSTNFLDNGYGNYIAKCYYNKLTCGGAIFAIITFPFYLLFSHLVATYTILAILLIVLTAILVVRIVKYKNSFIEALKGSFKTNKTISQPKVVMEESKLEKSNKPIIESQKPTAKIESKDDLIIADEEFENVKTNTNVIINNDYKDKEKAKNMLGLNSGKLTEPNNEITSLKPEFNEGSILFNNVETNKPKKIVHTMSEINTKPEKKLSEKDKENLKYLHEITGSGSIKTEIAPSFKNSNNKPNEEIDELSEIYDDNITANNYKSTYQPTKNNYEQNNKYNNYGTTLKSEPKLVEEDFNDFEDNINIETEAIDYKKPVIAATNNYKQEAMIGFEKQKQTEPIKKPYKKPSKYVKPPTDLLDIADNSMYAVNEDYTEKAKMLEETLESFNAPAKVVSITKGPAFTRFELQMQQGVPVKRVNALADDIAMILKARGDIRMEIPIAGKNAFGVEIPNEKIEKVALRDIVESYNFQSSKSALTFALGKDITGEARIANIDELRHTLVAGATGSGKSVCLNAMLISLLYKASPEDLRILLVDPKRVEFTLYNGMPHLLIPKAITDIDKAIKALDWLILEMERRFTKFAECYVRDLKEYNDLPDVISNIKQKMPNIVFIIDELGDLMIQNKKEIEEKIIRLTQKARSAGIYLVLATQRPSVDVITGTIKGNLPSRIAFAVSSFADSKTILDQSGAEKLLGKGDMLFYPQGAMDFSRIQGAFVSNAEVQKVIEFVKNNNECDFDSDIEEEMFNKQQNGFNVDGGNIQEFDALLKDALRLFIKYQVASISKLQRAFGIGFPRAAKIVDQMEAAGFVGPKDNKNMRPIYITQQEFEERFGEDL